MYRAVASRPQCVGVVLPAAADLELLEMGVRSTEGGLEQFVRLCWDRDSWNGQDPHGGRPHVPHGNREPCRRRGGHPRLGRGKAPKLAPPSHCVLASKRWLDEA